MLSANVIETVPILENLLDTNGQSTTTNSKYLVATFNYKKRLQVGRTYWYAYAYRWSNIQGSSLSSGTPTWVGFWYDHGARSAAAGKYDAESTTAGTDYYCSNSFTVTPEVRSDQKFSYCSIYHGDRSQTQDKAVRGQVWCAVMYDITDWKIAYGGKGNSNPEQDLFNIWKARATGAGSEYTDVVYNNIGGNQTKLFVKSDAVCPIELVEYEGLDRYQAQSLLGKLDPFLHNSTLRKYDYNNVLTGGTLTINNDTSNIDPESPFYPNKSESATKITVKGATARSDGKMGGFMYPWKMGEVSSGVVVQKLIAKVPVGYSLQPGDNWPTATKNSQKCKITVPHSVNGTGKYEEYTWIYEWNNCSFSDLPKSNVKEDISKTVSFMSGVFSKSTLVKSNLAAGTYTITNATFTTSANYGGTAQEPLMQGCLVVFKAGEYVVDIQDSLRIAYTRGNVLKVIPITNATYTFSEKFDLVFYNIDSGYLDNWLKNNSDEIVPSIAEYTSSGSLSFSFTLNWQQIGNYWAGYVYIMANSSSVSKTDVTWYVAYYNNIALKDGSKDVSKYKYYTVLSGKDVIGGDKIFTNSVDSQNIFANGDFSDINMPLPSNYEYISDQTILQGKARTAIRQKVGAAASWNAVGPLMKINPLSRYKFSCDIYTTNYTGDFYTALIYYRYADKSDGGYNATNTLYRAGTRTTLAKDLNPGDMNVYLSSMDNWSAGNSFNISTRFLTSDRHNSTLWADDERGVATAYKPNGYVIMKNAYTGSKIASGTTVVESCTGAVYYYPVCQWSNSTTKFKDGWAHYEVFFGTDGNMWDGCNTYWADIPMNAKYVTWCPNGAANTSGNPVYFANIRIEDVGANSSEKQEGKVQLKKFFNNLNYGIGVGGYVLQVAYDSNLLELTIDGIKLFAANNVIIKSGTTVTVSYKFVDSGYVYDSSAKNYRQYTGINITSSDVTISNNSFTMPSKPVSLTISPTYKTYYKVEILESNYTTLTIGTSKSSLSAGPLYILTSELKTIYYSFDDSHTEHTLNIYYESSYQSQKRTYTGNFQSNPSGNTYLRADASTPVYNSYTLTVTNLDSTKYTLLCNSMKLGSDGDTIREGDTVQLKFIGKEHQSSGVWYKYMLKNYSPSAYSSGLFSMPSNDLAITVNYEAKQEYNITTSATGCSISVASRAALGETVYYSIQYNDSNNRTKIVISWGDKEIKTTDGGSFTMPAEDVTITASAWEYVESSPSPSMGGEPVAGFCVYTVDDTRGHRNMCEAGRSTADGAYLWPGYFDELGQYKNLFDFTQEINDNITSIRSDFEGNHVVNDASIPITNASISIGSRIVHVVFSINSNLGIDTYSLLIEPCAFNVDSMTYSCITDGVATVAADSISSDPDVTCNVLSTCRAYCNHSDFVLIDFTYSGWQGDPSLCCNRLAIVEEKTKQGFFIDLDYCMTDEAQHPDYSYDTYLLYNMGGGLQFPDFQSLGVYCDGTTTYPPSHLDSNVYYIDCNNLANQYMIQFDGDTGELYILVAICERVYGGGTFRDDPGVVGIFGPDGFGTDPDGAFMLIDDFMSAYDIIQQAGNQLIFTPNNLQNCYYEADEFFSGRSCLYISLVYKNKLYVITSGTEYDNYCYTVDEVATNSSHVSYFTDSFFTDGGGAESVTLHDGSTYTGQSLVIM